MSSRLLKPKDAECTKLKAEYSALQTKYVMSAELFAERCLQDGYVKRVQELHRNRRQTMIILFLLADTTKRIHMGSLFFKIWHIVYEKTTKKEVKKMINSFIYSFIYLIRFLCEIIITLAAVKYLMPEIGKSAE